ncbi:glycine cleavage system H protein [Desulfonispora thiosulfatigenes DSM 11270]|uniref:Glycine cleavage system H protein n=1 Tax=Desulfonispora thiosulfatigenes DSM 11270 TaxID=656914 RepID=A0A1W1ULJ8_DESTI|nr:glycine cleavage system protein GcvH [Desulfonispora thiosulfatigenes]SMB81930.1 glycine cleavage system H protein [Desulfonispora thiosulfatigenes DSM 11270]
MKIEKDLVYSKEHEWVRVEGNEAVIGISDFAQHSLGDIVFVELPEVDDEFDQDEILGVVESVKAASDVYIPVSGKVIEVNDEIVDNPALINQDPYEHWFIKVELKDKGELEDLLSPKEYKEFLSEEE